VTDHERDDQARYRAAISWLEAFIREPGLERMRYLLRRLENPQDAYPTVHVGGTSGKGSTTTLIGETLRRSGFRVGIHTTPYLQTPLEKILVDDRYLAPGVWADLVDELKPHADVMARDSRFGPLNYGELSVALTYLAFARARVDWGVIEVGMGGRLDFTNVITPRVAVITTVSYDHLKSLGPTLADIASHKAGIIKPGRPAVIGVTTPEALGVIEDEARRAGASLIRLGQELRFQVGVVSRHGTTFDCQTPWNDYRDLRVGLLGEHQAHNAALAVGALDSLRAEGVRVTEEDIRLGLANARFPGRLELVQEEPSVILDGAHNPEKAIALGRALDHLFPDQRRLLVLGVLESKDVQAMIESLALSADDVIATEASVTGKVAVPAGYLANRVRQAGKSAEAIANPIEAIDIALSRARPGDLVIVTGSLYLVGKVRERWAPTAQVVATGQS
jgi:dihydrofolate synthase / folylpolyglutamate synthase